MGADIKIEQGYICAEGRLKGAELFFDQITVTGSENIIMAAAMAKGKSRILNVAQEPEVLQLCNTLKEAGVDIQRVGEREWEIVGTDGELIPIPDTHIIPDRIEAGTYLAAGAITNSQLSVVDVIPGDLEPVLAKFREMGYRLEVEKDKITIYPAQTIQPVQIVTAPHPEFPTDMQAQFMAIATQADGVSLIEERLFENRFMHVQELNRLGANIVIRGKVASVYGPTPLVGADVMATDLRASSALVLAGLIAKGETRVHRIYHLFRGYEKLIEKFRNIGAKMEIGEEPRP
jgi:UDP-N-acetylglucosamine 1-carboxyvinyltransferase